MRTIPAKELLTCFHLNHVKVHSVDKILNYQMGAITKWPSLALIETYFQSLLQSLSELADVMVR